ncbi:MAG TPA: hypothetical protein VG757_03965 [Devosia sp.]|nr:hypothetical protein [Devosia sp.]
MADKGPKPYIKLAGTLVTLGAGIFMVERYGLSEMGSNGRFHVDANLLSILVIVPVVLVAAGAIVFMYGKMRRL